MRPATRFPSPDLEAPVMVVLLDGWVDAGRTLDRLERALLGSASLLLASFDADDLVDYRKRRPMMHVEDGVNTGLDWPSIELRAVRDLDGRDVVVLVGLEPDRAWRAFGAEVIELAREFGVRMVVSLGAYPAATAHTRPVVLSAVGTTPALVQRIGYLEGKLDVPGGVHAAIERACALSGIPCVGMWAPVPHYLAAESFPSATVALLQGLAQVADRRFITSSLESEAQAVLSRLDSLVRSDVERSAMVTSLESHTDTVAHGHPTSGLPSGDELAAQFERFLGEPGNDPDDPA